MYYEFEKCKDSSEGAIEIYRLHKGADEDFNIIATQAEMQYCLENGKQIKKMREKAKMKEDELFRSDISLITGQCKKELKMPVPNHLHCGVCRVNFEDYNAHVESKEHNASVAVQQKFYEYVDRELQDLKRKSKVWKTSPIRIKTPAKMTPVMSTACKQLVYNDINNLFAQLPEKNTSKS